MARLRKHEMLVAVSAAGFAVWAIIEHVRRRRMNDAVPAADTSSFGPVEMIDSSGHVTSKPTGTTEVLVPRPGDVSNVDFVPDADVAYLCARAPLRSFGPECEGYNWIRGASSLYPDAKVDLRTLN